MTSLSFQIIYFIKYWNYKKDILQVYISINSLFYLRISMETASMGGLAGFQYIAPNHIVKTSLQ